MFEFDFEKEFNKEIASHFEDFITLSKQIPILYEENQKSVEHFSEQAMQEFSELYSKICANVLEQYHTDLIHFLEEKFETK